MMAKPSDYPGFRELLKEWNRRLKDSDFDDIESNTENQSEGRLFPPSGIDRYKNADEITRECRIKYFSIILEKLATTRIENEFEKQILTLYSQGLTQAEIHRKLGVEGHRCKVYNPLYRWLRLWGLKE